MELNKLDYDSRASKVKKTLEANKGQLPENAKADQAGLLGREEIKFALLTDMKSAVRQADSLRTGGNEFAPVDLSFDQFIKGKFGFSSMEDVLKIVGINPAKDTMDSFVSSADFDEGYRWLLPEVIREAVRLGMNRAPQYPELIAQDLTVSSKKITLPSVNTSAATPEIINENETIPVGQVSFGEKDIKLQKMGTGLKISDDVQKYVPINILSLYLQDAGVQLGLGLEAMALDVLINGDAGQNNPAPVVGVKDETVGITYYDLLRVLLRMANIGKIPTAMLSGEEAALDIMMLEEFRNKNFQLNPSMVNVKTPIPNSLDYLLNGSMPEGKIVGLIHKPAALIKLTSEALKVESERIAERQITGTYVTTSTGFGKLFDDAFVMIDGGQKFTQFPDILNKLNDQKVLIK